MTSAVSNTDVQSIVGDIMEYIKRADTMLEARDNLSLVTLNDMVDTICERINGLKPEQAAHYADDLQSMVTSLNNLQARMVAAQNEVSDTIKGLNTSRKANRAYISAPES